MPRVKPIKNLVIPDIIEFFIGYLSLFVKYLSHLKVSQGGFCTSVTIKTKKKVSLPAPTDAPGYLSQAKDQNYAIENRKVSKFKTKNFYCS